MIFVLNYHKKSDKNIIVNNLLLYSSLTQRFTYPYGIDEILHANFLEFEDNLFDYTEDSYGHIYGYTRTWDQVYNHIRFYYIDGTNIKFIDYAMEHFPEALL